MGSFSMLWHFLRGWISLLPPTQMHMPGPCSQYPGPCSHVCPGCTLVIWHVSRMCSACTVFLINSTGSCLMISLLTHFLPLENTALSPSQILLMLRETESLWYLNRRYKATCISRWSKCAGGGVLCLLRWACSGESWLYLPSCPWWRPWGVQFLGPGEHSTPQR